ncbi:MAG: ATP-binding cassette domain-containing protein [Bacteroidota bacterium]
MGNIILDIQNVQKSFALGYSGRRGVFDKEYRNVIGGLSVRLEQGKVTALVGGNGAGKTSLFNLISGLLRPDGGLITYHGDKKSIECTKSAPWTIAAAGVGRMFQGTRVFGDLRIIDHLFIQMRPKATERPFDTFFQHMKSKAAYRAIRSNIYDRLRPYDELMELLQHAEKPASSLSFAQQRLLSLAGLLLGDYKLILLDEPSSSLHPESFNTLYRIMDEVKKSGKSIFLIEHNMDFIIKAACTCHYMAEGRIKYSGQAEEVLNNDEVKQSYLL